MKSKEQNFVVEYKSGRRRVAGQSGSIWGKTDIRSLLREAESSHGIKNSATSAEMSRPEQGFPIQNTRAVCEAKLEAATGNQSVSLPQDVPSGMDQVPTSPLMPHAQTRSQTAPSNKRPNREHVAHRKARVVRAASVTEIQTPFTDAEVPDNELEALDLENLRLKRALVDHLMKQNAILKDMLQRFESY